MPSHHNNKKEPITPYSAKKNTTELDLDETITSRRRGCDYYRTALLPYDRKRRASQIEGDSDQRNPAAKKLRINGREEEDQYDGYDEDDEDENNEDNKDNGNGKDDEKSGLANPSSRVGKLLLEWCQGQHRRDHPSIDRKDPANGNSASDDEGIPKNVATTPQQLTELVSDSVLLSTQL
ncbi:hypothetical protein KJ359_010118 [Pestalotiopsis sp. 9143b]|nr:hypothetical protein KJ359_010118 [Pestalotiopsis sp. 9143b]